MNIGGDSVADENIYLITKNNRNLKELTLAYCSNITSDSIKYITSHSKKLVSLRVSSKTLETSSEWYNYIGNLHELKVLHMGSCPGINDENVNIITKNNKKLEDLCFSKSWNISSNGLKFIDQNLTQLKVLAIDSMCPDEEYINFGEDKDVCVLFNY